MLGRHGTVMQAVSCRRIHQQRVIDRACRDTDPLPRERIRCVRRRDARGAVRQHEDRGARAEHLWPRRAPLSSRLPRLRQARWVSAAALPTVSAAHEGKSRAVRRFVRTLLPEPMAEPIIRFETDPGLQMQADWATVGRGTERLSVFIATLGWSRMAYVEFCDDRTASPASRRPDTPAL